MSIIGLIGGSGLEKLTLFRNHVEVSITTPYGDPGSTFLKGEVGKNTVFILSRHGRDHTITPTHVNNRANIYALKELGCDYVIATTACGSLREEIERGHIVILDQFLDFTRLRINTFYEKFEPGNPFHISIPEPFSAALREKMIATAIDLGLKFHPTGTMVTIEGPRFSTRAESIMYRNLGADVINMSIAPEAALAKEIGLNYAAIGLSTDYDSWKHDEKPVTWEEVFKVFEENVKNVTHLLEKVIPLL
ncbi:MAG: S-methyl-5'-thioadenosine phosphorylase [Bacteroidales bacterium]|jgi:5'-methylthioadenosine phosphorylase